MTRNRKIGTAIAVVPALIVLAGFAAGLVPIQVGVGIAMACIFVGVGVARGKFSGTPGK